jgi:2Fe-2S ferredoxin
MAEITFVHPDGTRESIDAPSDESVMDAAFDNDVDGLLGDCGGNAMCATCHVYVLEPAVESLPAPSVAEAGMLDTTAAPRRENSRLSCQLFLDEPATLEIPDAQ